MPDGPQVTFDGMTATISGVQFEWRASCWACKRQWKPVAPGGRVQVALHSTTRGHRWAHERNRPPARPFASPGPCPHCAKPNGMMADHDHPDPHPVFAGPNEKLRDLIGDAYRHLRATLPDASRAGRRGDASRIAPQRVERAPPGEAREMMSYCTNPDHGVADTCERCAKARETALAAQVERLTADNAKLRASLYQEERRSAALLVDADRRERRAAKTAESCDAHGKEIQYLRHIASWYWASLNQQEEARTSMITQLVLTLGDLGKRTEPVPVATLVTWLNKAVAAHQKVFRRPNGYPALADCLADGNCDHDGLSDGLATEIAEALGLPIMATGPAPTRSEKKGPPADD